MSMSPTFVNRRECMALCNCGLRLPVLRTALVRVPRRRIKPRLLCHQTSHSVAFSRSGVARPRMQITKEIENGGDLRW